MTHPNRVVLSVLLAISLLVPAVSQAATFVVPDDRDLVRRADAIVLATPVMSYGQFTRDGGIETVTKMSVEETIKGTARVATLDVVEPGGTVGNVASYIAGSPRFENGQRLLLFLKHTGPDRWSVADLVLGKFSFSKDETGRPVLARDASEITGWDPDLNVHRERTRDANAFLQFVRSEAAAKPATENYFLESTPQPATRSGRFTAVTNATFTATSYTMTISGSQGARWNVFPNGVTWFAGASGEPGAPGNGTTAVQTGIAAWDNDPNSNVNYVYGGTDSTHTQGLHATDGANTVLFERDLSSWGVTPFQCSGNSYSGTLGLGGVTSASGTNALGAETFVTTKEGDVEMNRGLANCTLLFNNGDFNSAVAHELGHTLGFRHSDQTRDSNSACANDPSLECSNQAIMRSFVVQGVNATLQAWDQHAVDAVYPNGGGSTCTPPSVTTQAASRTITAGQSTTLSVVAVGTAPLTYQWYVGTSGNTNSPVNGAIGSSLSVAPTSTTSYWVRISNGCGVVNSATVTVTVTAGGGTGPVRGDFNADGIPDIVWRNFATGQNRIWLMSSSGTVLSSVAILSATDLNFSIAGTGDFNGDGKQDIVWRNYATGDNLVWIMNGTTYSSTLTLPKVADTNWRIESVNDFNGDGKPDLLWRHYGAGVNVIWYMNGAALSSSVGLTSAPDLSWRMVGSGNFNGDGAQDILWRNSSTGQVLLWYMGGSNSATLLSSAVVGPSLTSSTQIDAVSSYNGDSIADIVLRNYATGQDVAWIMSPSGTISTTLTFPTESNLSWHIAAPR